MTLASGVGMRVVVIVLAALLALQLGVAGASSFIRLRDFDSPMRPALIDQAAAAADLMDQLPADQRSAALRALDSPFIRFRLIAHYPEDGPKGEPLASFRPLLSAYASRLGNRPFQVYRRAPLKNGPLFRLRARLAQQVGNTFVVLRLKDGGALVVEPGGAYARQMRMNTLAVLSTALGGVLLVGLVWASMATSRPLKRMAAEAERFSLDLAAPPLAEQGPRDVANLARAFNGMKERIRRLVGERTRTLAAVAHDLKTYLTRVRMRTELIADPEQRERAARDLEEMTALIDDTLAFARATDPAASPEPVVLADVARDVVAARSDLGQPVTLSIEPGAETAAVLGAHAALVRALANLVENALRYGGNAEVRVWSDGKEVVAEIRDHGPGVPNTELERITEPFYRLEPSRSRDTGGSGLGLAIVKAAAEQAGGKLELSNHSEEGLVARVRLPRA
jgi:signal transduction histidine kinase